MINEKYIYIILLYKSNLDSWNLSEFDDTPGKKMIYNLL